MTKIYLRNMGIYALYVTACMVLGVIFCGFEGYFTLVNVVRLMLATGLALACNCLFAYWEYEKRVQQDELNNYIAERIKNAKHMSLEELDNL